MITMAKMMYDMYIKPRLGEKGQDMVEYALMLAIIVGIGWMIYNQAKLDDKINSVFNNAASLMESAASKSAQTTTPASSKP
ncbi:Flp family type IVb pilin [Acidaminococcus fermentans]|uniref:Flp family type IVb pilin n=1 Tax=Acidaminococcus fermentans TaxID=905 RepID=UPI003F8C1F90